MGFVFREVGVGAKISQGTGYNPAAVMSQKAVTEELNVIKRYTDINKASVNLYQYNMEMGTILGTGKVEPSAPDRAHTASYINLNGIKSFYVAVTGAYKYFVCFYGGENEGSHIWENIEMNSNSKEYPVPANANYMRISVGKTDNSKITTEEALEALSVELNGESAPVRLSVGTFNIGHFCKGTGSDPAGTAEEKIPYRRILSAMRCDVIGITENDEYYDAAATETSYNAVYAMFKHYLCSNKNQYDCYGVVSDYALRGEKRSYYTAQHWQGRGFYKCEFNVGGKTIALINTQLEWSDKDIRRQQIAELIAEASKYTHVIIMGDFNPDNRTNGQIPDGETREDVYQDDYALWENAGYSLANTGYYGTFNTIAQYEGTTVLPWDNIIVSNNIRIKSVERIKDDFLTDHYPLRADLVIYDV